MLIVVSVIGIMAAMALPQIGRTHDAATDVKDQSNAQRIVSVYHSALAMGLNFDGDTLAETIDNVVAGGTVPRGVFEGMYFGLPNLPAAEKEGAARFISVAGGALQYVGTHH